jgi:hypothetical protein
VNQDTGRIYEGDEIAAAEARGEKLIHLAPSICDQLFQAEKEAPPLGNRAYRRHQARNKARQQRKAAKRI